MKLRVFQRHLQKHGCAFLREGANHTVWYNTKNNKTSTVPRHPEVDDDLAVKICKDLEISRLKK